jgi:D-tyrosyl-tRNA(Tyr) deacylase
MRVVIQRVKQGSVTVDGEVLASIEQGLVILLGIRKGDGEKDALYLADKCAALRVFEDGDGKMNRALLDVGGKVLVVSQFTLYGDARKGNRPSFSEAMQPGEAEPLYERFVSHLRTKVGEDRVVTGVFRAMMDVLILNDGPVTIVLDSP